jgi:hypothetical protein
MLAAPAMLSLGILATKAEAVALDPEEEPVLKSFHEAGRRVLAGFDRVRRVMATAARRR